MFAVRMTRDHFSRSAAMCFANASGGPPDIFAQHIRAEREKWSRLIRANNIVVN